MGDPDEPAHVRHVVPAYCGPRHPHPCPNKYPKPDDQTLVNHSAPLHFHLIPFLTPPYPISSTKGGNISGSDSGSIKRENLAADSSSSSVPDEEELALRIAPNRSWMDRGGSSSSTASLVAQVGSSSYAASQGCTMLS